MWRKSSFFYLYVDALLFDINKTYKTDKNNDSKTRSSKLIITMLQVLFKFSEIIRYFSKLREQMCIQQMNNLRKMFLSFLIVEPN